MYGENVPRIDSLHKLADTIQRFPDDAQHLADRARSLGYDQDIISFLHLFHPGHVFRNRQDFINSCEELEMIVNR